MVLHMSNDWNICILMLTNSEEGKVLIMKANTCLIRNAELNLPQDTNAS
jgi:hypothetical protein